MLHKFSLVTILLAAVLSAQQTENPAYIPIWQGHEPIQFCIEASMESYRAEATAAFMFWADLAGLPHKETRDCTEVRTVAYRLSVLPGNLGVGMYPPPLIAEPHAGDVQISSGIRWELPENKPLLMTVLLHETGHAFGMGESRFADDIMFPRIRGGKTPSYREIRVILCLYRGRCE